MEKEIKLINPDLKILDITEEELAALTSSLFRRRQELFKVLSSYADDRTRKSALSESRAIESLIDKIILDID